MLPFSTSVIIWLEFFKTNDLTKPLQVLDIESCRFVYSIETLRKKFKAIIPLILRAGSWKIENQKNTEYRVTDKVRLKSLNLKLVLELLKFAPFCT